MGPTASRGPFNLASDQIKIKLKRLHILKNRGEGKLKNWETVMGRREIEKTEKGDRED